MAFPDGWAGYDEATVTNPTGALTDFTFLIALGSLSATWWSNVASDGGEIRVTKADGTQIPADLIKFTDGSPGSGLLACKYSSTLAASGTQKIRIYAGMAAQTFPADNDTYGADNAYASHWRAFWPDGLGTDRTSVANNLTASGTPTVGGAAGPINGSLATDLNGSSQYGTATASVPTAVPMTLVAWGRSDSTSVFQVALGVSDTAGANESFYLAFRGDLAGDTIDAISRDGGVQAIGASATGYSASTYCQAVGRFASITSRHGGINGVLGTENTTSNEPTSIDTIGVGALVRNTVSSHFDGRLSLVHLHNIALSAEWLAYDKEMLDDADQSDFYGTWAWTGLLFKPAWAIGCNSIV